MVTYEKIISTFSFTGHVAKKKKNQNKQKRFWLENLEDDGVFMLSKPRENIKYPGQTG